MVLGEMLACGKNAFITQVTKVTPVTHSRIEPPPNKPLAIDPPIIKIMPPLTPLLLAFLLSAHGLRKKSLSPSGAFTAFQVGFLMFGGATRVFGVTLIGFYLIGSRATKCEHILIREHAQNKKSRNGLYRWQGQKSSIGRWLS